MRVWIAGLVVFLSGFVWSCATDCQVGEVRVGDKCLGVADADLQGSGDAAPDAEFDSQVGDTPEDTAGAPTSDSGTATPADATDARIDGRDTAADSGGSVDPNEPTPEAGSNAGEGDCAGTPCVADACHPNPCGHGACVLSAGGGFGCKCEPDWDGAGTCTVNTNAALGGLSVSSGTLYPAFSPDVSEYIVHLPLDAPEVHLTATAAQPDGVVLRINDLVHPSGTPTTPQVVELNKPVSMKVKLTATNGNAREYLVVLKRTLVMRAALTSPVAGGAMGRTVAVSDGLIVASSIAAGQTHAVLFPSNHGSWSQGSHLRNLGEKIGHPEFAISDKWLVLGAPADPGSQSVGQAHCYRRDQLARGDSQPLPNEMKEEAFGRKVAIFEDTIAVMSDSGLYLFDMSTTPVGIEKLPLYGEHLALGRDLVVASIPASSSATDQETTVVYRRSNGSWSADPPLGTVKDSVYGGAVTVSDGTITVADLYVVTAIGRTGAPRASLHSLSSTGNAWTGSSLSLPGWPEVPWPVDPNGFGYSSTSSSTLVAVGAPFEASQRHGVHRQSDPYTPRQVTERLVDGYGVTYVFTRRASGWKPDVVVAPPKAPEVLQQALLFGWSVSYDRGVLVVGAPTELLEGVGQGQAFVFGPDCAQVPSGAALPGC